MARPRKLTPVLNRRWEDPVTGRLYTSEMRLKKAITRRNEATLRDFVRLVKEGTLDQQPWERLPGESELQYSRFRVYLTFNAQHDGKVVGRSKVRIAERLNLSYLTVCDVAKTYHWALRAECWDRELDRQLDEEYRESKRISVRRQARLGERLQQAAHKGLDILIASPTDMTPSDVAKLADTGVKIERLAMDKSTSNEDKVTRFVYEGQKPKWAEHAETVTEIQQVDVHQPQTIEGER